MAKATEYVPVGPFKDLLNGLLAEYEQQQLPNCQSRLCEAIGWPIGESGVRRLYRYSRGLADTKINGKSVMVEAQGFSRAVVEDACHHAGVDFYELYPEFEDERRGEPAPEGWCPACAQSVLIVDACCVWCSWIIAPGHQRPSISPLPIKNGREGGFDRAVVLRAAGLSYPAIVQVMGLYHGLWFKEDFWRRACRASGVKAIDTGFARKAAA